MVDSRRAGYGPDLVRHHVSYRLLELRASVFGPGLLAVLRHDVGEYDLSLVFVRHADGGRFGDHDEVADRLFYLAGAQAVARDVYDVVRAPHDEVITFFVLGGPVEGRVEPLLREIREVGLDEALVVPPHRAHTAGGQRWFDRQDTALVGAHLLAGLLVHEPYVVPVAREASGASSLEG